MSKQERKRKTSLGVLFWIAAILLILVVFLLNRRNIEQVMDSTGLVEVINQRIGVDEDAQQTSPDSPDSPESENQAPTQDSDQTPVGTTDQAADQTAAQNDSQNDRQNDSQNDGQTPEADSPVADSSADREADQTPEQGSEQTADPQEDRESEQDAQTEAAAPAQKVRTYQMFLVDISPDGVISVNAHPRDVSFVDSPLTRTIQTLIDQPAEQDGGALRNLIPPGTRINRIWIENSVAYLDLSEDFRFNPMGMEGHRLQLEQLVRTATQFSTVDAVRFLIDGESVEFLGGEGTYIGSPLSPADF
jgi:germination protein M